MHFRPFNSDQFLFIAFEEAVCFFSQMTLDYLLCSPLCQIPDELHSGVVLKEIHQEAECLL